ncbi:ATPase, histidine kinase-, DNA gyrase B-, and HSP90-like domain protein [gamma proteobacterium HTCC5015]|nr:ATPase, histidine kinase-, DNA gyrase B-, and HSP90-like domain protein [gamma proteobacterium HTCC5015]
MSVRQRILLTLLTFSTASVLVFASAVLLSTDHLEYRVIEATYKNEMRHIQQQLAGDDPVSLPQSTQIKAFWGMSGHVPADFIPFGLGSYHDIPHQGHYYHLYVEPLNGDLLYTAINIDRIEVFEETLAAIVLMIGVAMLISTIWISWVLTRYVIRPVSALASDIETLKPGARSLPERQYDPDLSVIEGAINEYVSRIDDYLTREKQFSGMASHELRTPVATIVSTIETLLQQMPTDQLDDANRERLKRLERASRDINYISESLLSLVKNQKPHSGEMAYRMSDPLSELVEDYRHFLLGSNNQLEMLIERDMHTRVDPELLRIIVGNLLRNSLQHGQSIVVRLVIDAPNLIISDTGEGLSTDIQAWLEDPDHNQLPDRDIGLGLYIVRTLVDRLGWTLSVEPNRGEGAQFTINTQHST